MLALQPPYCSATPFIRTEMCVSCSESSLCRAPHQARPERRSSRRWQCGSERSTTMKSESPMRGSVVPSDPNGAEGGDLGCRRIDAECQGREWELPAQLESCGAARRLANNALEEWHIPAPDVVSVLAELVGNALVHASGPIRVGLYRERASVRVEVRDQGGGMPRMCDPAEEGVTGRGLRIVRALSTDWGVVLTDGSAKTVWAEVLDEPNDSSAIRDASGPGSPADPMRRFRPERSAKPVTRHAEENHMQQDQTARSPEPELGAGWSQQQIAYYRARAGEYDDAYADRMRLPQLACSLDQLPIHGDVLELACGTGQWTKLLADRARTVTAVDAAPEMIAIARSRVSDGAARFITADLFDWEPEDQYDTVFFAFWLSHVPPSRFSAFWDMVRSALKPGGRAVFLDDSLAKAEIEERVLPQPEVPSVRRRLADGTEYTAVKVFYEASDLVGQLVALGWEAVVRDLDSYHLCGVAHPVAVGPS
ncbi:methyltransferase domain-containing protein [Streptomyces sp. NPDC086554]|uniref:methyltransferase domain-containing protein n=1 Tax=Streptomyces sp. NPDC086554 TaxID=3154864 RepID=UPI0034229AE9